MYCSLDLSDDLQDMYLNKPVYIPLRNKEAHLKRMPLNTYSFSNWKTDTDGSGRYVNKMKITLKRMHCGGTILQITIFAV